MKRLTLFLFINFLSQIANSQGNLEREMLAKSALVLKSKKYFSYKADYRIKYFDNTDTTINPTYRCYITKAPEDTILKYYANISNWNESRVYNGTDFLLVWHKIKAVTRDIPKENGKRFALNNIGKENVPSFFYSDNPLKTYMDNGKDWVVSKTKLNENPAWKIEFNLPTDEEISFSKRILYIHRNTLLPLSVESFAKFRDIQDEYSKISITYFNATKELVKRKTLLYTHPANYKVENYIPIEKKVETLSGGSSLISFTGTTISAEVNIIDSITSKSKIIVLDFWHLACAPCLRSLPKLSKLYDKYKNKGVIVYGLNPYDTLASKISIIKKLVDAKKISYQLLFIDKSIMDLYKVNVFPTLYIIKDNKIIYSAVGPSDNILYDIEKVIRQSL